MVRCALKATTGGFANGHHTLTGDAHDGKCDFSTPHDARHVVLRGGHMGGKGLLTSQYVIPYLLLLRFVPLEFGFMELVLLPLSPLLLRKLVCTSLLGTHQCVWTVYCLWRAGTSGTREGSCGVLSLSIRLSRACLCQLHSANVTCAEMTVTDFGFARVLWCCETIYLLRGTC